MQVDHLEGLVLHRTQGGDDLPEAGQVKRRPQLDGLVPEPQAALRRRATPSV